MARPPDPPVKLCPEKGCNKKMAAFRRGSGWKYVCPDAGKHAADKLKAKQRGGDTGKGGVRKGTPSPMEGKQRNKPYKTRFDWTKKRKKEGGSS